MDSIDFITFLYSESTEWRGRKSKETGLIYLVFIKKFRN